MHSRTLRFLGAVSTRTFIRLRGGLGWGGGLGWVELCLIAACGNTVHNPKPKGGPDGVAELAGGSGGQTAPGGIGGAVASAGEAPSEGGLSGAGGARGAGDEAPVLITGRVVSLTEHPLAGVVVEVDGDRLVTAADGSFRTEAQLPYDLVVHHVQKNLYSGAEPLLSSDVYLGVTRQDPKLYGRQSIDRWSALRGRITGGAAYPLATEHYTQVILQGPLLWLGREVPFNSVTVPFNSFDVFQPPGSGAEYFISCERGCATWSGAETAEATLFALQQSSGSPGIVGVGSRSVTLTHDSIVESPNADIVLKPPQYRDLVINVTAAETPTGAHIHSGGWTVKYNRHEAFPKAFSDTAQVLTGLPDEVGFAISAVGDYGGRVFSVKRWVPGDAASLDLHFGAAPSIQSPDPVVYDQPRSSVFRFTPAANAVTAVLLCDQEYSGIEAKYCINVFTNDSSLELQRLLDLGLEHAVPPRTLIRWDVVSRAEADSVDAFLDPSRIARAWTSSVSGTLGSEGTGRTFFYE